jgi:N-acetyl-anhydromuramyl-L-alanine amidase AmpD
MLSDNQLARAVRANLRWQKQLGKDWPSNAQLAAAGIGPLKGEGDFEFAEAVEAYQAAHGMNRDGILGQVTSAALRGAVLPVPKGQPHLIVGGEVQPAPDCRVVTWQDPCGLGLVDFPVWRNRPSGAIDLLVLHLDGCRSSRQCYDVLIERGLSAHLLIDRDGTIYQTLDLKAACAFHAGKANARSIGVEICNPERPERNDPRDARPVVSLGVSNAGPAGARGPVLGFYPQQVDAVIALARALASLFPIPLLLPKAIAPEAHAGVSPGRDARVVSGEFRGICGHYHLQSNKTDPGTALWPPLRDAGVGLG